ncbi:EAL domain-containing protein [Anoxybacillus sp. LAT_31]|uniref:putative bifunctional diguanylate cyclase/phosphodiesterase n=1 Tax=unclassified Anoxybacillus TaxID=2639704 RepID=UPI001EDB981D|nr:EAL domain-containing protein [Anoxybacillus sp. LAT27]MCG5024557.1 EAL domain-containing protein [Anoxybacillus flavithermus]MCG6174397.1 EAL domain-containing protein [Anoxybacillus sp. LAT_31]MCG6179746.1 EAL domain-containing protein [Anoxybacillus sp. LAT_33]
MQWVVFVYVMMYYVALFVMFGKTEVLVSTFFSLGGILFAIILLWRASIRIRTNERTFWKWMTIGSICYFIAEMIYRIYEWMLQTEPPFPIFADVFYLLYSCAYIVALLYVIMQQRKLVVVWQSLLDATIVMCVVMAYSWIYIVEPMIRLEESILYISVLVAYPLLDLVMLFLLLHLFFVTNVRRIWLWNMVGVGLFVFTDTVYFIQMMQFNYESNSWLDPLWIFSLLMIALSGYYAKDGNLTFQKSEQPSVIKIMFPYVCFLLLLCAPFIYPNDRIVITCFVLAIGCIFLRQWMMLKENRQLLQQLQTLNDNLEQKVAKRTSELMQLNEQLTYAANHDVLTGLFNRRAFVVKLEQELIRAKQQQHYFAVIFIDMDRFKQINDYFGHQIGDELIVQVGRLLKETIRPTDFIARQGGDEFTIIFTPFKHVDELRHFVHRLVSISQQPVAIRHLDIRISLSVGVAVYPYDGETVDTLMKHADIALYRAKEQGKNQYQFFNGEMDRVVLQKTMIETALHEAIDNKQFTLFYQPQFDVQTGELIGMEALIRWIHPKLGVISPAMFIPIAEETGQIIAIGEWVIEEACRQIQIWNERHGRSLRMSVNISPKQFLKENFVEHIRAVLQQTQLLPDQLDLEITEGVAVFNEQYTIQKLQQLKQLGVHISIDDFGTGYSSLSYLRKFPIDRLKIAKPFIDGITEEKEDVAVVKAIIVLAKNLKLRVIAEGVETLQQLNILRSLQCDEIQGYVLGKPVPADLFTTLYIENQLPHD